MISEVIRAKTRAIVIRKEVYVSISICKVCVCGTKCTKTRYLATVPVGEKTPKSFF